MKRARSFISLAFAAVSALATAAAAQETIPKELALALLPLSPASGGDILVGKIPADLAPDLPLPVGARVLGTFVSPSAVYVALAIPGTMDSARALVTRALVAHGWAARERNVPTMGGLQYGSSLSAMPTILCKGTSMPPEGITIAAHFYGPNTALVKLTRTQTGACDRANEAVFAEQRVISMSRSPFASVPPLYAPGDPRAGMMSCRSPSMSGTSSQNQPLRSELSASEILAHYGRQLDSAGWKSGADNVGTVTRSWSKGSGTRDAQDVTITVSGMPGRDGCYSVTLSATYRMEQR